jgi:amino-acid N-acetyltransferase
VIGAGGLERCGTSGLLRSVAVTESWRNSGVGRALVARLEQRARELALGELVLLTQTARRFFEREGYRLIERAAAPQAVQASEEFRLLCPKSAVCMSKTLV